MWQYYQPNPCGLSTGDCTVRAISKALDISWDEAHDILSEFAKNMCDMPHKDWVWGAVLRANGFNRMIIPDYCPVDYSAKDFGRDSMGRYSSGGDFRMELEEIMQDAPNEAVRQKLMETMNMM